jgi:hypothetical protein
VKGRQRVLLILGPKDELATVAASIAREPVRLIESRPMGAACLLRGLWEHLKVDRDLCEGDQAPAGSVSWRPRCVAVFPSGSTKAGALLKRG